MYLFAELRSYIFWIPYDKVRRLLFTTVTMTARAVVAAKAAMATTTTTTLAFATAGYSPVQQRMTGHIVLFIDTDTSLVIFNDILGPSIQQSRHHFFFLFPGVRTPKQNRKKESREVGGAEEIVAWSSS